MSGIKHDQEKNMLQLLPIEAIEEVGKVLTFGAGKYDAHNWRGGFKYSRLLGAMLRHLFAFIRGENNDPETGISHIAHLVCGSLFLLTFILEGRNELDDRHNSSTKPGTSQDS